MKLPPGVTARGDAICFGGPLDGQRHPVLQSANKDVIRLWWIMDRHGHYSLSEDMARFEWVDVPLREGEHYEIVD